MDILGHMQVFVAVVEAGGIGAAAERLDIAKSAVSRRLAELEAHLGVALIRRTTRRISLTDDGRAYYPRCIAILADVDDAEAALRQAHGALRGRLRVTLPMSFGLLHLTPLIESFMARHPDLQFDLDFNDRRVDLIQEGFDLAIRIARLDDSSLIARRLAPVRHGVYASPAYLAAHAAPSRAGELAGHACLVYSDSSEPGLWHYVGPDGTPGSIRVPARVTASSGDFLLRAALDGLGVILLPTFYVAEALRQGALVPVLADHAWPELSVYAVYPPTRHLSGRVRGFIDFLAERLAGEPYWDRA